MQVGSGDWRHQSPHYIEKLCCVENGIKSVAFCCISTGEFHFPNDEAVYCILKIPTIAEGNPESCMRNFPIIADAFGISLRPQQIL